MTLGKVGKIAENCGKLRLSIPPWVCLSLWGFPPSTSPLGSRNFKTSSKFVPPEDEAPLPKTCRYGPWPFAMGRVLGRSPADGPPSPKPVLRLWTQAGRGSGHRSAGAPHNRRHGGPSGREQQRVSSFLNHVFNILCLCTCRHQIYFEIFAHYLAQGTLKDKFKITTRPLFHTFGLKCEFRLSCGIRLVHHKEAMVCRGNAEVGPTVHLVAIPWVARTCGGGATFKVDSLLVFPPFW